MVSTVSSMMKREHRSGYSRTLYKSPETRGRLSGQAEAPALLAKHWPSGLGLGPHRMRLSLKMCPGRSQPGLYDHRLSVTKESPFGVLGFAKRVRRDSWPSKGTHHSSSDC